MKIKNYKKSTKKNTMIENMTFEEFLNSNGFTTTKDSVREDATVMACVSVISSYIASMSLRLYQDTPSGTNEVSNNLTNMLSRPNKLQSDLEFMKCMVQDMLIYGESFARATYKAGNLVSLEIIKNGVLSETYHGSGKWIVTGSINNYSVKVPYENVVHFRDLFDRSKTLSGLIQTKLLAQGLIDGSFDAGLQNNVKGIINLDGQASTDTKIKIKESFNKVLKSSNDFVAVVDNGMKYDVISNGGSHTFQEAQLKEILERLDEQIHKIFNVPMVMTSVADGSYNISEALISQFVQSLLPLVKGIEKEMSYKLLTSIEQKDHYFKIDYKSLMRASDKDRAEYYKTMVQNGFYSVNEVRALENMDDIVGGDIHLMSLNYVPLEKWEYYVSQKNGTPVTTEESTFKGGENDEEQVL